jgi:protease-4
MTIFDAIKSLILILIILLIAPFALHQINQKYATFSDSRTQIGVLPIRGIIYDSSFYLKQLQQFFTNPEIKGIVLKLECPGAASGTAETIYTEIQALKRQYPKPVIGLIENICTAGGYWIACGADYLIAPGTAIIGTISATLPPIFRCKDFMEQHHIKYSEVKAEAYQSILSPFVELTPQEKELLQTMLQDTYQQFIHLVAQARKISLAKIDQWADGKTFTGQQAYKLHLIDEIGSLQRVMAVLKQKALIEGDIKWIYPPSSCHWVETMFGMSKREEAHAIERLFDFVFAWGENHGRKTEIS